MANSELNVDEIVEKMIGYADRIDTPFGEMCTISCDMGQAARLYKPIEETLLKLRKHLVQRQQQNTFDGNILNNLFTFSVTTILEFFGMNSKNYSIFECGSHEISPYVVLGQILRVNCPTNREGALKPQDNQIPTSAPGKIQVYVSQNENYCNVIPWKYYGCCMHPIEDKPNVITNELSPKVLADKLSETAEISNMHIVSLSAVSNQNGQKVSNLQEIIETVLGLRAEMALRNPSIKIYLILDITQLAQRERININNSYLKDIDFLIFHSTKLLGGGFESANIIIKRNDLPSTAYAPLCPTPEISFDILNSLRDSTDVSKLYRVALSLQLLESFNIQKMTEMEKSNVEYFVSEIALANAEMHMISPLQYIRIWGIKTMQDSLGGGGSTNEAGGEEEQKENIEGEERSQQTQFEYGNLNLTLCVPDSEIFDGESRSYIHPDLACQLLHDLFGIQASFKLHLSVTEKITILNIPRHIFSSLGALGSSDAIVGSLSVDISFLHKKEEIKYLVQGLRMICEKGQEMSKYYDKRSFQMNSFNYDSYDFQLSKMEQVNDTREGIVKKRLQMYDNQLQSAKNVFKNLSRYFSLNNGYSKDKTEQIRKKDVPGCFPPVVSVKSVTKAPIQSNQKQAIVEEGTVNLHKIAIEKVQNYLKDDLFKYEEEKRLKQEALLNPPPSPPVEEEAPPPVVPPKESEDAKAERMRKAMEEVRLDLEKQVQEMIAAKILEEQQKEKSRMEELMEIMKKEMDEKIKQSSRQQEQFVFEDVQPSMMFKNVLDHREKRYRNLRLIFNNYAKLNEGQNKLQSEKRSSLYLEPIPEKNSDQQSNRIAFTINLQQYILFCNEFSLMNEQVDINVLNQIYGRSMGPNRDKSASSKEMHFTEFVSSLEKISYAFFLNDPKLITNYDKMEALYEFMEIDDILKLRKKMSNSTFHYLESKASAQTSVGNGSLAAFAKRLSNNGAQMNTLSEIDLDQQTVEESTLVQVKKVSMSQDMRIPSSIKSNAPRSFQPSTNSYSTVLSKRSPASDGAEVYQELAKGNKVVNWGNVGNTLKINPEQFFKNDSTLTRDNNSVFSQIPAAKMQRGQFKTPSSDFQPTSKGQSLSPIKYFSDQRGSIKSLDLLPNSTSSNNKRNSLLERIKEIEDIEIQKQRELLAFIQSNQKNRYNSLKKKP